ncbi:MAG: S1C family serine protease [Candidatus Omnitrophica bacterium]|nr:S1C family serine protease [Candidatus Omnitrophota bacterium]
MFYNISMKHVLIAILMIMISVQIPISSAQGSIIFAIERSKNSVVEITSEIGGLFRSKPTAVKDAATGRILLAQKVGAAKYTRTGAGVIIDNSGTVVTNAHTVEGASRITLTFNNGETVNAEVIGSFPDEDITFLKPEKQAKNIQPVIFVKPTPLQLRTRVFSIGYSDVLKGTIAEGKITGIGKNMHSKNKEYADLIQVSLSIYKGDSGGPLFNEYGEFLGLLVGSLQKTSKTSYAIPAQKIAGLYIKMISPSKT